MVGSWTAQEGKVSGQSMELLVVLVWLGPNGTGAENNLGSNGR